MTDGRTAIIGVMVLTGLAMIGLIVLIAMGHDSSIVTAFLGISGTLFAAVAWIAKDYFGKGGSDGNANS